jgi:hypothetical protein
MGIKLHLHLECTGTYSNGVLVLDCNIAGNLNLRLELDEREGHGFAQLQDMETYPMKAVASYTLGPGCMAFVEIGTQMDALLTGGLL